MIGSYPIGGAVIGGTSGAAVDHFFAVLTTAVESTDLPAGFLMSDVSVTSGALGDSAAYGTGSVTVTLSDSASALDTLSFVFLRELSSSVLVTDAMVYTFYRQLRETVAASAQMLMTGEFASTLADEGRITDTLAYVFPIVLQENLEATDGIASIGRILSLVERLRAADTTLSQLEALAAITIAGYLRDTLDTARLLEYGETGEVGTSLDARLLAIARLAEAIAAGDAIGSVFGFFARLSDLALASDAAAGSVTALVSLLEQGVAIDLLLTLNEGQDRYLGHVINTETGAPGWYDNVPFDSLAWSADTKQLYAAKADGIYVFDADDDDGDPIRAYLRTGVLNFQTNQLQRIDDVHLLISSDAKMYLRVVGTSGGVRREDTYLVAEQTSTVPREQVVDIGRGPEYAYVQFELHNTDGADFDISRMTVYPVTLTRRRNS